MFNTLLKQKVENGGISLDDWDSLDYNTRHHFLAFCKRTEKLKDFIENKWNDFSEMEKYFVFKYCIESIKDNNGLVTYYFLYEKWKELSLDTKSSLLNEVNIFPLELLVSILTTEIPNYKVVSEKLKILEPLFSKQQLPIENLASFWTLYIKKYPQCFKKVIKNQKSLKTVPLNIFYETYPNILEDCWKELIK